MASPSVFLRGSVVGLVCLIFHLTVSLDRADGNAGAPEKAPGAEASTVAGGEPRARLPNIILISIDTLRQDRLGAYGYPRSTTPSLDRLASRGVRFANAFAPSSWTLPSHVTLFTGLRPREHGVTRAKRSLPARIPSLTQVLRRNGYRSRAWTDGGFVSARYGLGRGFEFYGEQHEDGIVARIANVEDWIASLPPDQPYFAFVHTYHTHCPYEPAPEVAERFRSVEPPEGFETVGRCGTTHFNFQKLSEAEVRVLSDLYDGLVYEVDEAVGHLFRFLDERDEWSRTIVIVVSDHGEEFQEHGRIGHAKSLHQELLRIPFLIAGPGIPVGVVSEPVGLIDVGPTVLDLLEIEGWDMEGRSLVPAMLGATSGGRPPPPPVVASLDRRAHLRSVVEGRYHYIVDRKDQDSWLYDLEADPGETENLIEKEPERAARLEAIATKMEKRSRRELPTKAVVSKGQAERLRALGYIEEDGGED